MVQALEHAPEQVKLVVDVAAVATWITVLTGVVTPVVGLLAALASLLWGCIRIWETKTVQNWLDRNTYKGPDV